MGFLKRLRIDFGAVKTWLQIALGIVMTCIYLYRTEKRVAKAETEVATAVKEVVRVKDSINIITRYQDARTAQIKQEIRELQQAGQMRQNYINQLLKDIKALRISEAQALRQIDRMKNSELQHFFSTIPTDEK